MRKITYEYLHSKTLEMSKRLDNISMAVCYLKNNINDMSEMLEIEYSKKYPNRASNRESAPAKKDDN